MRHFLPKTLSVKGTADAQVRRRGIFDQIQDYALLVGSLGLFAALAAVMWFTRKIDWYEVRASD